MVPLAIQIHLNSNIKGVEIAFVQHTLELFADDILLVLQQLLSSLMFNFTLPNSTMTALKPSFPFSLYSFLFRISRDSPYKQNVCIFYNKVTPLLY